MVDALNIVITDGRCMQQTTESYNVHPWWKVDLEANHCLGRITLVNRGDDRNERLNGAVVRAGIHNDIFNNAACGLPVTRDQASIPGAHLQIVCDPPVIARYVSVDDDFHVNGEWDNLLTLCEVMVEEYPMEDCLQTTEKNLLIFLFGILVWFYPLSCLCLDLTALDLHGMQASQISDYENSKFSAASRAVDGNLNTSYADGSCSNTGYNAHPWWKVDLEANHCLGRITLVNRGDAGNERLNGAVVRAGIHNDIFNNAACGLPVTRDQASIPGAHLQIVCDPPVIARYVSVDDDFHVNGEWDNLLTLCEVMVEEYPMEDCLQTTIAMIVNPSVSITCLSTLMFVDKEITNARPLSVVHMKSPMQCFMRCKMNNECWSFDYVMTSGQCRLYDVKAGDLKADDQPDCLVYAVVRG
ncbi:uncharacterized protein [Asterias amurensis]|uniref:uncharacterized protein n=1 Tax=Asterias amurensis TaxID=7602 RepID=UPI003AB84193